MVDPLRVHHATPKYHWSHHGACDDKCFRWYAGTVGVPCGGRECPVLEQWRKP